MPARTNEYGLTWKQWFAAATLTSAAHAQAVKLYGNQALPYATLKRAWLAGEDPTDWCAELTKRGE